MMTTILKFRAAFLLICVSAPSSAAEVATVNPGVGFLQIAGALVFILLLMFGSAWLLKRIGPITSGNKISLKVIGGINVGTRERVLVVEVDDQWMILGVTANNISNLGSLAKRDLPTTTQSPAAGAFQDWLKRTMDKRDNAPNEIK
ncbi:flagellar biosynthetic protein FliO [Undibacterium sp. SXout11W]|uniref:flagellar biosynthetic protein FliO n=1 Tax=Undibacterium sp. SXout11W TaxID=3413050 RepID=UPI003BF203C6